MCLFQDISYFCIFPIPQIYTFALRSPSPTPSFHKGFFTKPVTFSSISLSDNPSNDSLFSFPNSKPGVSMLLERQKNFWGAGREADHI